MAKIIIAERLVYSEVLKEKKGQHTKADAENVLEQIRKSYSSDDGWRELKGYVEKGDDGLWYAVRHHQKYEVVRYSA